MISSIVAVFGCLNKPSSSNMDMTEYSSLFTITIGYDGESCKVESNLFFVSVAIKRDLVIRYTIIFKQVLYL